MHVCLTGVAIFRGLEGHEKLCISAICLARDDVRPVKPLQALSRSGPAWLCCSIVVHRALILNSVAAHRGTEGRLQVTKCDGCCHARTTLGKADQHHEDVEGLLLDCQLGCSTGQQSPGVIAGDRECVIIVISLI